MFWICQVLNGRIRPGRGGLLKIQRFNFELKSHFYTFVTKFSFPELRLKLSNKLGLFIL